jgi:hypothetical protein
MQKYLNNTFDLSHEPQEQKQISGVPTIKGIEKLVVVTPELSGRLTDQIKFK